MRFIEWLTHWLTDLLRVQIVWLDKGQGRWVRSYRLHPFTRGLLVVVFLSLLGGLLYGAWFAKRQGPPEKAPVEQLTRPLSEDVVPKDPAPLSRDLPLPFPEQTVFPPLSEDPDALPSDLREDEYWIRILKGRYTLYLYRGMNVEKVYTVAIGKNEGDKERAGDHRTPIGSFSVQSIEDSTSWTHDFRDGKGVIRGAYGPWFIRLKTGWKGIGIHGTHDPDSLGSMASEGCIRMKNEELKELQKVAFKNMKVVIEE